MAAPTNHYRAALYRTRESDDTCATKLATSRSWIGLLPCERQFIKRLSDIDHLYVRRWAEFAERDQTALRMYVSPTSGSWILQGLLAVYFTVDIGPILASSAMIACSGIILSLRFHSQQATP